MLDKPKMAIRDKDLLLSYAPHPKQKEIFLGAGKARILFASKPTRGWYDDIMKTIEKKLARVKDV